MVFRISTFALILVWSLAACSGEQALDVGLAQRTICQTWQADHHIVWKIEWPTAPIGGSLTAETWQSDARYRYEILEASAPALIGAILISDGQQAWQYNRFEPEGPPPETDQPWLSPVSDAFATIEDLLAKNVARATVRPVELPQGPTQAITLYYGTGDWLTLWRDDQTGLPARISFGIGETEVELTARHFEPLIEPPEALFRPAP